MFPFGRGLCHAYWAPNFWVFYIILDKSLAFVLARLGFNIQVPAASFTGGLVGDSSPFAVLPTVSLSIASLRIDMTESVTVIPQSVCCQGCLKSGAERGRPTYVQVGLPAPHLDFFFFK